MKDYLINTNRKGWVDALRGLAIILVIYGHNINNMPNYYIFTSPIKMPLFFAISGYVFNANKDWLSFLGSTYRKLIVPWLLLGLFFPFLLLPFKGLEYPIDYFLKMLSGEMLWFMPCFIISEIIHYTIRHYCKNTIWIIIISFFCFTLGLILYNNTILNYAMFNRALTVQPFFLIGFLFKKYESKLIQISWFWICVALTIYLGLCFLSMKLYPGQSLDVHLNRYYNIPYCLILVFLGCFCLFTSACKYKFNSWVMSFIGQNTLVLYIWHGMAIIVLVKICLLISWGMPINGWTALIKTIWAVLLCGFCAFIINKYLPFVVGKKKANHG